MKAFSTFILSFLLLSLASCLGEEPFSTAPDDKLVFSHDTLDLDTVIAGQSTNTYTFQIFNPNKKALHITRAALGGGASSPFAVNVDGMWLASGTGGPFTVYSEDSLRVFVNLNAPVTDLDDPQPIEEHISFFLESGGEQRVVLTAAGQDVVMLKGEEITEPTRFQSPRPYQIMDSLVVREGATLTLGAGVRLYFHPGAELVVHGTLKAEGTFEKRVVMRGDRLGNMFSNQPYDRIPGQWGGVHFTATSKDNDLTWCDIHAGDYGILCDSSSLDVQKLIIDNSIIHNTRGDAFHARHCQTFVANCQLTNAGGNCVTLLGGDHTFMHCTIGEFYPFTGGRGVALSFNNFDGDVPLPLTRCQFVNSIITGYADDDIMGSASETFKDTPFNYVFKNCLMNTPRVENEAIIDCIFEEDTEDKTLRKTGNFFPEFDTAQLLFPFTLSPKSAAVGMADINLTLQSGYTSDLNGKPRTTDGKADIGAYEAPEEEQEGEEP